MSGRFATQARCLLRWFSLSALLTMSLPAQAVTVSGLYSVEVEVDGSSQAQLREGYARGLHKVLLRVSGTRQVLENEEIQALLDNAESYLQSYQFLGAENGGETDRLRMSFGPVGVNRALAEANAPVWGANRPLTLAWIAVQSEGTRELVTAPEAQSAADADDESAAGVRSRWSDAFRRSAADRGLPLALPPEDFRNERELLSDVWGQFGQRLKTASEALSYDIMATVRVSQQGNEWRAAWSVEGRGLDGGNRSAVAADPEALAASVVGAWADTLAEQYAVAAGDVGDLPRVEMVIRGVSTLQDYARINRILSDLAPVQQVGASRVASDRLTLTVSFNGELEQLKEYVALEPRFVPVSEADQPEERAGNRGRQPVEALDQDSAGSGARPAEQVINPLFRFQPLLDGDGDNDQAFDSLYQILHYRWEPAPGVVRESGSDEG